MNTKDVSSTSHDNTERGIDVRMYAQTFWSPSMVVERMMLPQTLLLPLLYTALLMWACLGLFWGSLTTNNDLRKLTAAFVDLEGPDGVIGNAVRGAIFSAHHDLDWRIENEGRPGLAEHLVINEELWAAVEVSANATSSLNEALANGIFSYNPTDGITLYYASARNQITDNSHVVPTILAIINPTLGELAVKHVASFLQVNIGNATALHNALRCPQCLAQPFVLKSVDLVPFDSPVASGSTMVGMIFLLTFTFSIFQILRTNGQAVGAKLRLSSTLIFRTLASLGTYFIMSLMYTLINLAFGVPMTGKFDEGAGFMAYWMLNWCTMAAVGLPMESLFTWIGMKWAGYFLSFWIIVNVSGGFSSFNIMPGFYQYGYAIPFYHSIQGARTIIFGTKSHLRLNFGVLLAWSIAGLAGMYLLTWLTMRRNSKQGTHELR